MSMDCKGAGELLAGYVLDALDPAQVPALEQHLRDCPACRTTLEQDHQVILRLPLTMKLVDPPPDLKARLFARIEAMRAAGPAGPSEEAAAPPRAGAWVALFQPRKRLAMGVTLAGVTLFLLGWTIFQTLEVNDLKDQNTRLTSTVHRQVDALTLATSPGVEAVQLTGTEMAPAAKGSLLLDYEDNRVLVVVTGLSSPAQGMVYRLWLWRPDGTLTSIATFKSVRDGYAMWPVTSPVALVGHKAWGLTLEPLQSSTAPEGPLVLGSGPSDRQR